MVAAQGLVTSVSVGEEGTILQLRTNSQFGSIRPICRAVDDDRFLRIADKAEPARKDLRGTRWPG
jgi:hypothetical protein